MSSEGEHYSIGCNYYTQLKTSGTKVLSIVKPDFESVEEKVIYLTEEQHGVIANHIAQKEEKEALITTVVVSPNFHEFITPRLYVNTLSELDSSKEYGISEQLLDLAYNHYGLEVPEALESTRSQLTQVILADREREIYLNKKMKIQVTPNVFNPQTTVVDSIAGLGDPKIRRYCNNIIKNPDAQAYLSRSLLANGGWDPEYPEHRAAFLDYERELIECSNKKFPIKNLSTTDMYYMLAEEMEDIAMGRRSAT